ncbi:MAG: hypothetical protein CHACPFDD_03629 [Phycisphaerae bacterium]|nr:hypothetical protein [Phycisphaerae bacterium]
MKRTPEALFELVVRDNRRGLAAYVRAHVHDWHAADELIQDVFVAAWQHLDQYDHAGPFGAWLRGVARNKVLEYYRNMATHRRHVRALAPADLAALSSAFQSLVEPAPEAMEECLGALRKCLAALEPRDACVVRASYEEGRSCAEIADGLHEGREAVKKRLQRARARLRECVVSKLRREVAYARSAPA